MRRRPPSVVKLDIVNDVSRAAGIPKVKAEEAVEAILDELKGSLKRGGRIEIRGFGVFVVKPRKRGVGRNPRTGERVEILPGRTVRFKAGKDLKDADGGAAGPPAALPPG